MSQTKPNDRMTAVVCQGSENYRVEQAARPNPGRFVEFSVFGADTTVDWSILGDRKELEVRGSHPGPYCHPIPIEEWDEAIRVANSLDSVKVLLRPVA